MNAPASSETTPILGTAMAGGFYGGRIRIDGQMPGPEKGETKC